MGNLELKRAVALELHFIFLVPYVFFGIHVAFIPSNRFEKKKENLSRPLKIGNCLKKKQYRD